MKKLVLVALSALFVVGGAVAAENMSEHKNDTSCDMSKKDHKMMPKEDMSMKKDEMKDDMGKMKDDMKKDDMKKDKM